MGKIIIIIKFSSFLNSGKLENLEWMFNDEEPILVGLENF